MASKKAAKKAATKRGKKYPNPMSFAGTKTGRLSSMGSLSAALKQNLEEVPATEAERALFEEVAGSDGRISPAEFHHALAIGIAKVPTEDLIRDLIRRGELPLGQGDPLAREFVGQARRGGQPPFTHRGYDLGFSVSRELIEDDRQLEKKARHAANYGASPKTMQQVLNEHRTPYIEPRGMPGMDGASPVAPKAVAISEMQRSWLVNELEQYNKAFVSYVTTREELMKSQPFNYETQALTNRLASEAQQLISIQEQLTNFLNPGGVS